MTEQDPEFFARLIKRRTLRDLWIDCSDNKVPANGILCLRPGEVFVHHNFASLVVYEDLNCLSVIQYAVDMLQVQHIIVVGHYGCGGVQAVTQRWPAGLADNWVHHFKGVMNKLASFLNHFSDDDERGRRLGD